MCASQPVGKKYGTGMTFGGFDLCHVGHVNLLRQAKELCDKLIVCVSSDFYIRDVKGDLPLLSLYYRKDMIRLTGYADVIDTQTMAGKQILIEKYNPDVLFVGDDWNEETYGGANLCHTEYLKRTNGVSTSLLKRIINEGRSSNTNKW